MDDLVGRSKRESEEIRTDFCLDRPELLTYLDHPISSLKREASCVQISLNSDYLGFVAVLRGFT